MSEISLEGLMDALRPDFSGPLSPEREFGKDRTPSRSDQFFHGTVEHHLVAGDVITPVARMTPERRKEIQTSTQEGLTTRGHHNTDRAWATVDPFEAGGYGSSIYEVTPVSESPNLHSSGHISDPEGLTVKRKLGAFEQFDHPQAHKNRK